MSRRRHVAVVTGGGGGIGAAVAEELGRRGWFVVTLDPMVSLDGTEPVSGPEETTADRIVAAGGAARASSTSVTDGEAVRSLFRDLADEHGGIDGVVNVAGITRQTYFAQGAEEDWRAVLAVHLGGYLNVLGAALPVMAETGHGHVLGVTSGSGWRAADAGAYSCAKRAVASLTWQLGAQVPAGVTVNAVSPIAATRMVAAALERARQVARAGSGGGGGRGGLSLSGMPGPGDLAPLGAYLVDDAFGWCSGRVLFAGGSELAVIDQPRLLEVVRTEGPAPLDGILDAVLPRAFASAEANQVSDGGGNPRFGAVFAPADPGGGNDGALPGPDPSLPVRTCAVVSDRDALAGAVITTLEGRGVTCHRLDVARTFGAAGEALGALVASVGPLDAVVVAPRGRPVAVGADSPWAQTLADHADLVDDIHVDAGWARAVADQAARADHPVRLVTLTGATTAGGRSRAQAAAQLARAAPGGTAGRVTAFAVGLETGDDHAVRPVAALVAHLLGRPDAAALAGAELVVGPGWLGLRSHPRPAGSVTYGGPEVPPWVDDTLREIVGSTGGGVGAGPGRPVVP